MAGSGRSPALIFILVTVVINSMGIGLMMPVMPDLLLELVDDGDASLAAAAAWGGALTSVYALMQFLISPTLGNLSDRFGRRPVLIASQAVMGVEYVIMALTPWLWLLFAARVAAGAAAATHSTANAYIADISDPSKRAANFGLTGAAFGVGFILGPALGGVIGEYGPRMPFVAAAVLTFANLAFGWFVLPESLKPGNRRAFDWRRANPFGVAKQIAKVPAVAWLLGAIFIYDLAHFSYPAVWSFYTKEKFGWGPGDIGLSLAVVGVGFAVVQGYLIRRMIPAWGEARTALFGLGMNILAFVGIAAAWEGWMIYALVPLAALSAVVAPAMHGLMANLTPDDAQGELQGAISALSGLGFVVTPIIMTQLFSAFTGEAAPVYLPGAPFYAAAAFSALAILPFAIGRRKHG